MKRLEELIEILKSHKQELKDRFGVLRVGIFGSVARGEETEKSDIDIYVELDLEKITLKNYLGLLDYLENLFGQKIDVITKDSIETIRIAYIKDEIRKSVVYA